jgi:predicted transcriptional regulator
MTMVSFRADDQEVAALQRWSNELGVERSQLLRDALHRYLLRLQSEREAEIYERIPLTDEELAISAVAEWGPAEDWSDWADAAR